MSSVSMGRIRKIARMVNRYCNSVGRTLRPRRADWLEALEPRKLFSTFTVNSLADGINFHDNELTLR